MKEEMLNAKKKKTNGYRPLCPFTTAQANSEFTYWSERIDRNLDEDVDDVKCRSSNWWRLLALIFLLSVFFPPSLSLSLFLLFCWDIAPAE